MGNSQERGVSFLEFIFRILQEHDNNKPLCSATALILFIIKELRTEGGAIFLDMWSKIVLTGETRFRGNLVGFWYSRRVLRCQKSDIETSKVEHDFWKHEYAQYLL